MQLQSKILLLMVPLIVLPVLALGWASYALLLDDARSRTQKQVTSLLVQVQSHSESQLQTARANAKLFANNKLISRYLQEGASTKEKTRLKKQVRDLLFTYQLAYPEYYEIRIISTDGREQLRSVLGKSNNRTTDESGSPFFQEILEYPDSIHTTFFRNPDNNQSALLASKPLYPSNRSSNGDGTRTQPVAFLVLTIDLGFLERQIQNQSIGTYGRIFVTDPNGTILFNQEEQSAGEQVAPDLFRKLVSGTAAGKPVSGQYKNQDAQYQGLNLHNWLYLFAVYPEEELYVMGASLGQAVAIITCLAVLLTIAFSYSVLKSLLIKPIRALGQAAKEIGRGQLPTSINFKSNDEIGELARTFKDMGDNLKHYHKQVNYIAYHDSLTGLPNRLMFKDYLNRATAEACRNRQTLAILFLDLDNFKRINDTLGHQVGDNLLKSFADRLAVHLRETDVISHDLQDESPPGDTANVVARLAGDEFIILLPRTTGPNDAQKVAKRILESLTAPFNLSKHELFISTSIGIAMYPEDGENTNELLKNADIAMYHAKKLGRNNYQYYSSKLNEAASLKLNIESKLRRAVENNELELYYQPQVNMVTGQLSGAEALLRWKDEEMGQISPEVFVPVAEEFGLIIPISEWIITEVCHQAQQWHSNYNIPFTVSINLSAIHFNTRDLDKTIGSALRVSGLDPRYLELELTETSILQDPDQTADMLNLFKDMGLQVALDDFGTGYSSLSYLMKLPIDKLKIDQSFIRDLKLETKGAAIVSAIINMAHSLDMQVIAEGVEEEEHMKMLLQMQCDIVQGYYIARPLSVSNFASFIEKRLKRSA